jgi:hypothetical protein
MVHRHAVKREMNVRNDDPVVAAKKEPFHRAWRYIFAETNDAASLKH